MIRRARRAVPLLVAIAISGSLLYVSLQGIEWAQVGHTIAGADPIVLGLVCALACGTLFLRALRWRVLLTADASISPAEAFWATAAGYFGNNFLPARAGELVRMHMVARQRNMPHAFVLATAIAERVADAIVLICISAAVILTSHVEAGWMLGAARTLGVVCLLAAAALAVTPFMEEPAIRLVARLPLPAGARHHLLEWLEHGVRGIRAFHSPVRLATFVGYTLVIWLIDAVGTVIGASALGLHMPLRAAFLLLAGLGLGSALPSTPGSVGIYQFVAVSVLVPFGFSRTSAVAYILVAQALSYVVIGIWGGIAVWRYRATRRSV